MGGQVSLFRFPRGGGPIQAYQPDSLKPTGWRSAQPVPPVRRLLGADLDERLLWALGAGGDLLSVDLETRAVRKVISGVASAVMSPDGSVYLVNAEQKVQRLVRRQPVPFHDPLPAPVRALFGAVNEQVVILTAGPGSRLITASADQSFPVAQLPPGEVSATTWGDLVAVAADTAVLLQETGGQRTRSSIPTAEHARRVGFSPSGHRLYLAEEQPEIRVFDRFSLKQVRSIKLPAVPRDFRVDASGRWLLARPSLGDSVWVVDLATSLLTGTVGGSWSADLPLVAGAATLLVRNGSDLAGHDLLQSPPRRIATLEGAGTDLWLAAAWVPRERLPAAVAAAESATVTQDSALQPDTTHAVGDSTLIFLQVSRTQNHDWADLLARQLKGDGYPASVLGPKEEEDGYRVLLGPYATREAAESTGRRLGRAYFILKLPLKGP